jgi:diguanylate cyclase (GGDEF)-like protein
VLAVGSAFVIEPLHHAAKGSVASVAVNLAYPLADIVLLALVVGASALTGWRLGRGWSMLGLMFVAIAVADITYVASTTGAGAEPPSIAYVLLALPAPLGVLAAWDRPRQVVARAYSGQVIVVPVMWTIAALGLLAYGAVGSISPAAVVLASLTILTAIGRTALTLREVRALAESRRQAMTDDLTGLANRRHWLQTTRMALIENGGGAILICDIDHFKAVNDRHGMAAGDLVLAEIGRILGRHGHAGRLGGDEFALLVPGNLEEAVQAAQRIMAQVSEVFEAGSGPKIDLSMGCAAAPTHGDELAELLEAADVALLDAKRAGRSRAMIAGAEMRPDDVAA